MIEPVATQQQADPLAAFMMEQRAGLPLVAGDEWATLQTVDALQEKFAAFMPGLDDELPARICAPATGVDRGPGGGRTKHSSIRYTV